MKGKKSGVSYLNMFGCMEHSRVPNAQRQKLDKKAMKLQLVGYFIKYKCYNLLDVKTSWIYARREVVFNEQDFGP